MDRTLTPEQGQALVELARQTIARELGIEPVPQEPAGLDGSALAARQGTFVTLTIAGELRGCIGALEAREPIVAGVRHNALNAAFHDPRFRPLARAEFERIAIEVSVLSQPQRLEYAGSEDLLERLRPDIDGVILRKGHASATFLPQVWQQLPVKEEFLAHLCLKAGLGSNAWRQGELEVFTYQVQYFEEAGYP